MEFVPQIPEPSSEKAISTWIKVVRIFLLVLIVIGVGLLLTIPLWVPKVVAALVKPPMVVQPMQQQSVARAVTWQQRTTVYGLSTTSLPYFTHYENPVVLQKLNTAMRDLADLNCVHTKEDIDDIISNRTFYASNPEKYTDAQLESMTPTQVMMLFGLYSDINGDVTYDKGSLVSVTYTVNAYCGGDYPDEATVATTFDLHSGAPIPFSDLFTNYTKDHSKITTVLAQAYSADRKSSESKEAFASDECVSTIDSNFFDDASFGVTEGGIIVWPTVSHPELPCGTSFFVPHSALEPYLTSSTLYKL